MCKTKNSRTMHLCAIKFIHPPPLYQCIKFIYSETVLRQNFPEEYCATAINSFYSSIIPQEMQASFDAENSWKKGNVIKFQICSSFYEEIYRLKRAAKNISFDVKKESGGKCCLPNSSTLTSEQKTKSKKCCRLFSVKILLLMSWTLPLKSSTTLWKHIWNLFNQEAILCITQNEPYRL